MEHLLQPRERARLVEEKGQAGRVEIVDAGHLLLERPSPSDGVGEHGACLGRVGEDQREIPTDADCRRFTGSDRHADNVLRGETANQSRCLLGAGRGRTHLHTLSALRRLARSSPSRSRAQMQFSKWHALGNSYVVVEQPDAGQLTPARVQRLCSVDTGIGSDGVLEVTRS